MPSSQGMRLQGLEVGLEDEIAVTQGPGRGLVAGHRLHFQVDGQKVVAAVGFLHHAVEEEVPHHPLAHEAALHVHHGDHDGVDVAALD